MQSPFTYEQARHYLTARLDFERKPAARPYTPTDYNLEGFVELLGRMENPQHAFPSIHIAGTKGKGSVAALLDAALRAAGHRTGLFTSPHLRDYPERIRLDGLPISPETFAEAMSGLAPIVEADGFHRGNPAPYRTVFELLTAMAFAVFARERVDIAILETGLGGRLDCTNVVRPEIAVITALGLDHTALLGGTLDRIAWEKGGIIKPGIPVVVAPQSPVAREQAVPVLERLARERNSPLYHAERMIIARRIDETERGQTLELQPGEGLADFVGERSPARVYLPLPGDHQIENLRTAASVWAVLRNRGWDLSWDAFFRGVGQCRWPGRIEVIPSRPRIVVDGAHCPLSIRALADTLRRLYPEARWHVVMGVQRDKDFPAMLRILSRTPETGPSSPPGEMAVITCGWTFYEPPGGRGAPAEELAAAARALGYSERDVATQTSPADALRHAIHRQVNPGNLIVVCGTLYTVAELLDVARAETGISAE
jgi:dihydrofolate synthase/folylpolyglutamate synthase